MIRGCQVPSRQNTGKRTNSRQSGGGGAEIGSSVMLGRPAAAGCGLRCLLPAACYGASMIIAAGWLRVGWQIWQQQT
jgi:hypothetical protein